MLKLRSKNNIVIAAANTGIAKISKKEVTKTDQTYKGKLFINIDSCLKNKIVQMKFIEANIEDTPTKWKLTIKKSTDMLAWPIVDDNGGYNVQPVPAPPSQKGEINNNKKEGGSNQKLKLFSLGKTISGAPIKIGTKKLPKPPNEIGTTTKKSMIIPCILTIIL